MTDLRRDLSFAARSLRSSPAFAVMVILTLAIGMGATTAIFSIVQGVVLKPLPFPHSERIVRLYQLTDKGERNSVSQPNFRDWAARTHSFSAIALLSGWTGLSTVQTPSGPTMARVTPVTRDFFKVLEVKPELGRLFTAEEQHFGGVRTAVIGDALWRDQFDASESVLGRRITWDNDSYEIIGVLPARGTYPEGNQIWVPMELLPPSTGRTAQGYTVIARLAAGASIESARRDISVVSRQMKAEYSTATAMSDATLVSLRDQIVGDARPRLLILLGASAFLLLIGLANTLNLMMSRLTVRQNELAIRVALGATAWRLVRQVLAESALLVAAATVVGLWLVMVAVRLVVAAPNSVLPRADEISVDWRVLVFTIAMAVSLTVALGAIAAWRSMRRDTRDALSASPRAMTGSASRAVLRQSMVVGQIALTMVLLTGAALLGRSFLRLLQVDPGFTTEHVAVIDATPTIDDRMQRLEYYNTLITRVRALPGVVAAGAGTGVPIANGPPDGGYLLLDAPVDSLGIGALLSAPPSQKGRANYVVVNGDYFGALRIPLRRGRLFAATDGVGTRPVAVVSERFAKQSWPAGDAIGEIVEFWMDGDQRSFTVVGIVGDVHDEDLAATPQPTFYAFEPQRLRTYWPMSLVVRTSADPSAVIGSIRRIVHDIRPDVAVRARTIDAVVSSSVADRRFTLFIIFAFAGTALLLATLGVYSVVSYVVTQRTREIGVRVALGAQRADVLRLVVGDAVRLTLVGLAIGVLGSLWLTPLLRGLVFGVSPTDPGAFASVMLVLTVVAVAAAYIPARRATRVDPIDVLRST